MSGCTQISEGCKNCYAERMAKRLHAMNIPGYENVFSVTLHPDKISQPLKWKKPQMIFVCSMGDLFHKDVPISFIHDVFAVMAEANRHTFQILTKRGDRLKEFSHNLSIWPENVWAGVTVEDDTQISRIDELRHVPAKVRFISMEPLLSPLRGLNLTDIHWGIVGGESGPGARPVKKEWVIDIQQQCRENNVSFFFKQWGGVNKKKSGKLLNGHIIQELPKGCSGIKL